MVLPFDPMTMTFKDLHYSVPIPKVWLFLGLADVANDLRTMLVDSIWPVCLSVHFLYSWGKSCRLLTAHLLGLFANFQPSTTAHGGAASIAILPADAMIVEALVSNSIFAGSSRRKGACSQ